MEHIFVDVTDLDLAEGATVDCFIAGLGYETRSRFVAERNMFHANSKVALGFDHQQVFAYEDNLALYKNALYDIVETNDASFEGVVTERLLTLAAVHKPLTVAVDISSLNRFRIAAVIASLATVAEQFALSVHFLYAPAFPSTNIIGGPVAHTGAVHPRYAGWSSSPESPVAAIVGLGYEREKAIGAIEYIEPSKVIAFRTAPDRYGYYPLVTRANELLLRVYRSEDFALETYSVNRPFELYGTLDSAVFDLLGTYRPALLPLGPKLFALCCTLLAEAYYPEVAVWRSTSGILEPPVDRVPVGHILGLSVYMAPAERAVGQVQTDVKRAVFASGIARL